MKGARVSALLTGVVAALVVAGCGVPPSGVIQAGDPATGMTPGVDVYFLSGDSLVAVPRQIPYGAGVNTAVRLLFEGPLEPESDQLSTELPRLKLAPEVTAEGDGTVLIRLFEQVPPFSKLAMEQLMCTVAAAPSPGRATRAVPTSVPTAPSTAGSTAGSTADGAHPRPTSPPSLPPTSATSTRRGLASGRPQEVLVVGESWHLSIEQGAPCPAA